MAQKRQKNRQISVHFRTGIPAETEISKIAETETGTKILVAISAGTGTEPNFGRSLSAKDKILIYTGIRGPLQLILRSAEQTLGITVLELTK